MVTPPQRLGTKLKGSYFWSCGQQTWTLKPPVTSCTVHCSSLLANRLRPLLNALVPLLISFPTKGPLANVACDRKVLWFCLLCYCVLAESSNLVLQMALHSFCDVVATLYHSFSPMPIVFRSFRIASLHLFLGPHLGRGSRSHPKRIFFGTLLSGMCARWPNHCNLRFAIFSVVVSLSPHFWRNWSNVKWLVHCCWLVIPRTILIHL